MTIGELRVGTCKGYGWKPVPNHYVGYRKFSAYYGAVWNSSNWRIATDRGYARETRLWILGVLSKPSVNLLTVIGPGRPKADSK